MRPPTKRDRDIVAQIGAGTSDLEVCRRFGLLHNDLELCLERYRQWAEKQPIEESPGLIFERAMRRRAENSARSLASRFSALLEASPEAIMVVNALTGVIRQVNSNAAVLFGYSEGDLVGRSVEDLVPATLQGIHGAYRVAFLSSARKREMGYHPPIFAVRADGSEVEIAVALTCALADEEVMVVCTQFARWTSFESEEHKRTESH